MVSEARGRRERKNAQTRAALADVALRLFLQKGYDAVSVKEIADAVDISVPTVFNHVPDGKEALIFDDGTERREGLLAAVGDRAAGQSVMAALRGFISGRGPFVAEPTEEFRRRTELIMKTPALHGYSRKLWIRCEEPLAAAIATEIGRPSDDLTARAVARYVLEIPQFVGDADDPLLALHTVFDLLEHGLASAVAQGPAGTKRSEIELMQ
ncbi:MAG TPA: TetR family transcriptional regulator [Mycobacterium sp.]|jgi:AcrR family transcriptional regulator|uniref:TetR/AcrR family transcriptional regulator n=1 Tax=Mycobacterium sp. TaxID=1785 RepID=UPI002F42A758